MLNFKKDLKMDFESYMKHIDTPIFTAMNAQVLKSP